MISKAYDVVAAGAGHDRLVCAADFAKFTLKKLVPERHRIMCGDAPKQMIGPGFAMPLVPCLLSILYPRVSADPDLRRRRLQITQCSDVFTPRRKQSAVIDLRGAPRSVGKGTFRWA